VIASAYPSKTLTYLRNGCPMLVLVESGSELAAMVREERIGITYDQAATAELAARLEEAVEHPELLDGARTRARALYLSRFERTVQLDRWVELVEDVSR
jgi:glycosyltransferase involved in cell wall biosynthesis